MSGAPMGPYDEPPAPLVLKGGPLDGDLRLLEPGQDYPDFAAYPVDGQEDVPACERDLAWYRRNGITSFNAQPEVTSWLGGCLYEFERIEYRRVRAAEAPSATSRPRRGWWAMMIARAWARRRRSRPPGL